MQAKIPVLVTGGAGYIGSHTAKLLFQKGFLPVTVDNLSEGHEYAVKWGPLIIATLQEENKLDELFIKYRPKAVIHFAASALLRESVQNPQKYYQNNLLGALSLLSAMKRHNVKNIIFSSTCATYGHAKTVPLKEDHIQNPVTAYGKSKFMIEQILDDYETAYGFKSIILRYFNAAGADAEAEIGEHHEMETHLIPLAIDTALNQYPSLNIFGSDFATDDGYAVRDYIHVEDLANAHILALLYLLKDQKSQKLNLGSEKGISVLQIIQHVEKLSKTKIKLNLHPKNSFEPSILLADCQIAKKVLQWSPRLSNIKKIIESAWIWHLKKQSLSKRK